MLPILIFTAWFLICCLAISKLPFFKASNIGWVWLTALFAIKIAAGVAYASFYKLPRYYSTADTWRFFTLSKNETNWLKHDPYAFFSDLFTYGYSKAGGVFSGTDSYWNDLKSNLVIKLLAICNLLTGSNYYADIILFNFLFFIGLVALYRVFINYCPGKKRSIIIGLFLLPSTLFWCSGIHKDGLILSGIGLLVYTTFRVLRSRSLPSKYVILSAFCLVLLFALRNYVVLALIPALFCWYAAAGFKKPPAVIVGAFYAAAILLFFIIPVAVPSVNLPELLANKQHEFRALTGGSEVKVPALEGTFVGFVKYFPHACDMAFLQPAIGRAQGLSGILAQAELWFCYLLILCWLLTAQRPKAWQPFFWFNILFGLTLLFIAGYTITFAGAMVRYRSIAFPFLLTPLLCGINKTVLITKTSKWINYPGSS